MWPFLLLVPVTISHLPECGQAQHILLSWKPLWFWVLLWHGLYELSAPLALWKQRHLEDKRTEATYLVLDPGWQDQGCLFKCQGRFQIIPMRNLGTAKKTIDPVYKRESDSSPQTMAQPCLGIYGPDWSQWQWQLNVNYQSVTGIKSWPM